MVKWRSVSQNNECVSLHGVSLHGAVLEDTERGQRIMSCMACTADMGLRLLHWLGVLRVIGCERSLVRNQSSHWLARHPASYQSLAFTLVMEIAISSSALNARRMGHAIVKIYHLPLFSKHAARPTRLLRQWSLLTGWMVR